MNDAIARLDAFIEQWRVPFEAKAEVFFRSEPRGDIAGAPAHIANSAIARSGFTPIGHHWEMLDTVAPPEGVRSARGALVDALSKDLGLQSEWFGAERALICAEQFLEAFDPHQITVLTNHIVRMGGESEAWNPITSAELEWAFVGYDDSAIAILVLTAEG